MRAPDGFDRVARADVGLENAAALGAASRFAGAAYLHARLALLGGLRACGGAGYKRVPSAEAD